jgi:hypothetical protein
MAYDPKTGMKTDNDPPVARRPLRTDPVDPVYPTPTGSSPTDPSNMPQADALPGGAGLTAKPAEKELNPQERLEALLFAMRENARHNAPMSPVHLKELQSIVAAGRGDKAVHVDRHEFPGGRYHDNQSIVVPDGGDGKVRILGTAEDALDYIRSLPDDVRNRPKWIVAERTLLDALDSNEPRSYQAAYTAIQEAQGDDERLNAPEREPLERLPDGRIREDRFVDRRLPEPVPPAAA